MNQSVTLKPHEKWRDTLLDASLIQLIFRVRNHLSSLDIVTPEVPWQIAKTQVSKQPLQLYSPISLVKSSSTCKIKHVNIFCASKVSHIFKPKMTVSFKMQYPINIIWLYTLCTLQYMDILLYS